MSAVRARSSWLLYGFGKTWELDTGPECSLSLPNLHLCLINADNHSLPPQRAPEEEAPAAVAQRRRLAQPEEALPTEAAQPAVMEAALVVMEAALVAMEATTVEVARVVMVMAPVEMEQLRPMVILPRKETMGVDKLPLNLPLPNSSMRPRE